MSPFLVTSVRKGQPLSELIRMLAVDTVTGALDAKQSPAEILEDVVWRHRNSKIAPKTVNQKRYVDSIRLARALTPR